MTSDQHSPTTYDDLTGVWIQPSGIRIDITRHGATWRGTLAMDRRGHIRPAKPVIWDRAHEVRAYISKIEAEEGAVRQPNTKPRPAPPATYAELWKPRRLVGPIILFVVLIVVGIAIVTCSNG